MGTVVGFATALRDLAGLMPVRRGSPLAMSWLKPLAGAEDGSARNLLVFTGDSMGHSLVDWVQAACGWVLRY